ncbi:GGT1 [Bugula neritina]|uniref:GGT1 n=1 Tax=Bugula neritina TaxID=10212 RepID=A0A7J7J6V5_BUGNE|nr:GGT1 [Bugula neritina]
MASETCGFSSKTRAALYLLVVLIVVAIILACTAIIVSAVNRGPNKQEESDISGADVQTDEVIWPSVPDDSENVYRFASVACAEKNCSTIGVQMLAEGGSGIDAMIAVSLCLGVARSLSSGVGGGGFTTYYNREMMEPYVLDYRDTAPAVANSTMYINNSRISPNIGGGSIAVPGEIAGTWELHQKFGKLNWSRLFEPSIELAENGITLNAYVAGYLLRLFDSFDDQLKAIFTDSKTGEIKKEGDTVVFTKLAETYRRIAAEGPQTFYNGSLRDDIVADLEELDGQTIFKEDLENYKPEVREPLQSSLENGGYKLISLPPPSGGVVVQYILNILDGYEFTSSSVSPKLEEIPSTATTYHQIIEAVKFAYASRMNLGDGSFVDVSEVIGSKYDKLKFSEEIRQKITDSRTHNVEYYGVTTDARRTTGTSQISILTGNGDAVSTTTTVNYAWGSKRMGKRTGIIFNNLMDDFSMPDKPSWSNDSWVAPSNSANWIEPGKRPLSSMSPTVVVDQNGDVVMVTGGSGGSKIITATALTLINQLWFGMNLTEAVFRPRLHSQLLPDNVLYENRFPLEYVDELIKKGHKMEFHTSNIPASDSVGVYEESIIGVSDFRRQGAADGF